MCAKKVTPTSKEVGTTGHSWDGIEELNNPLPRWWVWVFYLTIIWGLGYTIAYPAWPLIDHATQGLIGGNARDAYEVETAKWDEVQKPMEEALLKPAVADIPKDAALKDYAYNAGKAVFATYCAQCHQAGGGGLMTKGYPNLIDNDWLFGGDMDAIVTTVSHGIRNTTDPEARNVGLVMPAWSEKATGELADAASAKFTEEQVGQVVSYVLQISGQEADAAQATAGAQLFADNCAACHGDGGVGNRDMGAPNLTDAIWLYGGDAATLTATVVGGRAGVMPAWAGRLSEADIRSVATYVHSLGGGE